MLTDLLKPEIVDLFEARRWSELREALADWPAPEIADLILRLRKADRVLMFRALARGVAAEVFSHLNLEQQEELLLDLTDEEMRQLLANLPPDDRTHLLEELPRRRRSCSTCSVRRISRSRAGSSAIRRTASAAS